jgi:hypothetical protein
VAAQPRSALVSVGIARRFASPPQLSDNCQVTPSTSMTSSARFCCQHKFTLCEKWLNVVSSNPGTPRTWLEAYFPTRCSRPIPTTAFSYYAHSDRQATGTTGRASCPNGRQTNSGKPLGWVETILDRALEKQVGDLRAAS